MKNKALGTFSCTAILVEDPHIGGYTAYFRQFPDIIAEGKTDEEAIKNLMNAVHDVFEYQSKIGSSDVDSSFTRIIEKPINFSLDYV